MIYMESTLVLYPDKVAAYRENEKGMYSFLEKYGYKVVGTWQTNIGNVNEFTVLVASEDMGQLYKSAMAMSQDRDYQALWQKISPSIMSHNRKIMTPMPTSPLK